MRSIALQIFLLFHGRKVRLVYVCMLNSLTIQYNELMYWRNYFHLRHLLVPILLLLVLQIRKSNTGSTYFSNTRSIIILNNEIIIFISKKNVRISIFKFIVINCFFEGGGQIKSASAYRGQSTAIRSLLTFSITTTIYYTNILQHSLRKKNNNNNSKMNK